MICFFFLNLISEEKLVNFFSFTDVFGLKFIEKNDSVDTILQKVVSNQMVLGEEIHKSQIAITKLIREVRQPKEQGFNHLFCLTNENDFTMMENSLQNPDTWKRTKQQIKLHFNQSTGIRQSIRICLNKIFPKQGRHLFGLTGANNSIALQGSNLLNILIGKIFKLQ